MICFLLLACVPNITSQPLDSLEPLGTFSDHTIQKIEVAHPANEKLRIRVAIWNLLERGYKNHKRGFINNPFNLIESESAWVKRKRFQYDYLLDFAQREEIDIFFLQETEHQNVFNLKSFYANIKPYIDARTQYYGFGYVASEWTQPGSKDMIILYRIQNFIFKEWLLTPCDMFGISLYLPNFGLVLNAISIHWSYGNPLEKDERMEYVKTALSWGMTIVGGDSNQPGTDMEGFIHSKHPTSLGTKIDTPKSPEQLSRRSMDGFFISHDLNMKMFTGRSHIFREWGDKMQFIQVYEVVFSGEDLEPKRNELYAIKTSESNQWKDLFPQNVDCVCRKTQKQDTIPLA